MDHFVDNRCSQVKLNKFVKMHPPDSRINTASGTSAIVRGYKQSYPQDLNEVGKGKTSIIFFSAIETEEA